MYSRTFRFNNSTLQRLRGNGQAFNPWHAIVRRLHDDGGTGESLHMPGQRAATADHYSITGSGAEAAWGAALATE